jgi:anti-repressor protein
METIINIKQDNKGNQVVSAIELYEFLEIKDHFTQWIERMLEYGFEENIDYQAIKFFVKHRNGIGGTNKKDYALTLDTAKEIAMLQRSDKGKQARQYFIQCEKQLKVGINQVSRKELALMVIEQEERIEQLESENSKLGMRSQFVDQVFSTDELIKMSEVAKLLDLPFGRNILFKKLREKGILFKNSNEPKQNLVEKGYFKLKEVSIKKPDNTLKIEMQTLVTQKGLAYIAKVFEVVQAKRELVKIG